MVCLVTTINASQAILVQLVHWREITCMHELATCHHVMCGGGGGGGGRARVVN